jgi:hypothetical protein
MAGKYPSDASAHDGCIDSCVLKRGNGMRKTDLLVIGLLLTGCGQGMEGTYSDQMGLTKYRFESSGKVYVSVIGMETELKYEKDKDKVKIIAPHGNQIFTVNKDGSLEIGMGMKLVKK